MSGLAAYTGRRGAWLRVLGRACVCGHTHTGVGGSLTCRCLESLSSSVWLRSGGGICEASCGIYASVRLWLEESFHGAGGGGCCAFISWGCLYCPSVRAAEGWARVARVCLCQRRVRVDIRVVEEGGAGRGGSASVCVCAALGGCVPDSQPCL